MSLVGTSTRVEIASELMLSPGKRKTRLMSKDELMRFEQEISDLFVAGQIKAPIHLSDGNEDELIELFAHISESDWVFSTHRSHYHALLHGIDPEWVKREILAGNSITIQKPDHKFFSSAIMGGVLPIAMGVAFGLQRKGDPGHVWVFVGDMCAEMGVFHETVKYSARHELPITFIVEDNGRSIDTPTQAVWGPHANATHRVIRYAYQKSRYPHVGTGKWVTF
jgi:TPP-dependent pyruvate/acetoin dehydrogenase alpha subunit